MSEDDVVAAADRTAARCFGGSDVATYDSTAPYPMWHVVRNDSYESSRLLVPGWLASFRDKVTGPPVTIVPERAKLFIGGAGDEECLRRLVEMAEREYVASPRSISVALYTVDDNDGVVPLVLRADHPLAHEVALGHVGDDRIRNAAKASERSTRRRHLRRDLCVPSSG